MEDIIGNTEPENRHCPICDEKIKIGSPIHHCSRRKLNAIEKQANEHDDTHLEEERTYDDRLREFDEQFNNSNYYDIEEE
jgi:tRNA G26 N,N-dimethylase Trm1